MNARSLASRLAALLGLCLLNGCSEAEVVRELRSLQGSEDSVFLCRDANGNGRPMSECPDLDGTNDEDDSKRLYLYALVTETITNEIAVVDVTTGHVVDVDPSVPGYGFLRVGGRPTSIAATPGGTASFVATTDVGQNGIFALPTNCLGAPQQDEPQRDLTTWPACRLDDTPGEIAMMVEPSGPAVSCDGAAVAAPDIERSCYAKLAEEGGPVGTRKLIVALPERGELAVIDAQEVLDTVPGTFPPCHIEKRIPLAVNIPAGVAQTLPPDLQTTCSEVPAPTAPPPSRMSPRPAGFAVSDDRLYVADSAAPVVHVLDTSSVCGMTELPSLLPMSLREPSRVVTTRRVAASPLTPSGKRFVYAIDSEDQPGASVMAFDVSPGSTDPTPIVRPGSPELPGELKPDRLTLGSSARDVAFAYRDLPYADPITGVAEFGTACDPDPATSKDSPGGLARPSSDYLTGARPVLLRGLFGFVLLTNGVVAIVDVEDFDAPCRRPRIANSSSVEDVRGCKDDQPTGIEFYTEDGSSEGKRTVTDEVSCRVVEPHRFRSATLAINDPNVGVRGPSLRGFPQLSMPASAAGSRVEDRPRLLGVPFENPAGQRVDSEVFIGSTRYGTEERAENALPVDPNGRITDEAETLNALVLPPLQPRAYPPEDTVKVTFEGAYRERNGGFLQVAGKPAGTEDRLEDSTTSFCAEGVYDVAAMTDYGSKELGLDAEQAEAFAREHADYVQITSALLGEGDIWWKSHDRQWCIQHFGPHDAESLAAGRDFRVLSAFADKLLIEPRNLLAASEAIDGQVTVARAADCFPGAITYRLRTANQWTVMHSASGFNHDVVASGADNACVRSCNPLKKWAKSRVFEISSRPDDCALPNSAGDPLDLRVGCAELGEVACVYGQTETALDNDPETTADDAWGSSVRIGGPASECIFDGLTARFAIYRGRLRSVRDAAFTWQTGGGYNPLVINLANISNVVSPQSIQFVPQLEQMAVVDGSSLGLTLLSLDTFGVVPPSPFF